MEATGAALKALWASPLALSLAVIAALFALAAAHPATHNRSRRFMVVLAVMSAVSAWALASR